MGDYNRVGILSRLTKSKGPPSAPKQPNLELQILKLPVLGLALGKKLPQARPYINPKP